jgi:hypothetical protein
MRVGAVVVKNQMNLAALRHGPIQLVEKRQELGVPLARRTAGEDGAVHEHLR